MDTSTMMLAGLGMQAGSKIAQGSAARDEANFNAAAMERAAAAERAAGSAAAAKRAHETSTILGDFRAKAAASGGGAGATILDLMGDIAGKGDLNKRMEIWNADERAKQNLDKAAATRTKGQNAFVGSIFDAGAGMLTGMGKLPKASSSKANYDPLWSDTTTSWG